MPWRILSTVKVQSFLNENDAASDIEQIVAANQGLTYIEVELKSRNLSRADRVAPMVYRRVRPKGRREEKMYALAVAAEPVATKIFGPLCRCKSLKHKIISNKTLKPSPKSKRSSESCRAFCGKAVDILMDGVQ